METEEPAERPASPDADHDVIRVVNATPGLAPAGSMSEDELRTLVLDLLGAAEEDGSTVLGDGDARASTRQTLLALPALNSRLRQAAQEMPLPEAVEFIQLRQLLYDRGVVPAGRDLQGAEEFTEDDARPPSAKELWTAPGKGAAAQGLAAWARAAAPDDHVALTAAVVLPAHLGRPATLGTGSGLRLPLEQKQAYAGLAGGRWGASTFWELGALRNLAPDGTAAERALAWLARQQTASLVGGLTDAAVPEIYASTRLDPRAYTFIAGGWQGASWVPRDEAAALGRALLSWHQAAEAAAGLSLVAAAAATLHEPAAAGSDEPLLGALLQPAAGGPVSRTVDTYTLAALGRAPLEQYRKTLGWLADQIARVVGAETARWPALPLNAAVFVLARGGAGALSRALANPDSYEAAAAPYLAVLQERVRTQRAGAAAARREQDSIIRARQYLIIVERKLGTGSYDAVMQTILGDPMGYDIDTPADILRAVRESSRGAEKLVQQEYENRTAEWEARAANDCPHVRLVRRLRAAASVDDEARAYKQLQEFFPAAARRGEKKGKADKPAAKGAAEWILCANCSFRLLCPHVEVLLRLRQRHAPYEEVRRALLPYASAADYASESGVHGFATYCRICSEELFRRVQADDEAGADTLGRVGTFDDELRRYLWVEAVKVADPRGTRPALLRFSQPVDPRQFATDAAAVCHPLAVVMAGRKRPGRLSAAGGSELARRYQEFVALVYLYAYLFTLLLAAPGRRSRGALANLELKAARAGGLGGGAVGLELEGAPPNAAADVLAQRLLADFVTNHSLLLSQLTGVTNEQVGALFQLAYRHLLDTHGQLLLVAEDGAKVFSTVVTRLSPYYAALQTGVRVLGATPPAELPADAEPKPGEPLGSQDAAKAARRLAVPDSPEGVAKEFRTIMGAPLDAFVSEKFDPKYMPFIRAVLAGRGAVQYPDGISPDWVYAIPGLGLYKKAWATRDDAARKYWARREGGRPKPRRKPADGRRDDGRRDDGRRDDSSRDDGGRRLAGEVFLDGLYLLTYYMTGVHGDEEWGQFLAALATARAREAPYNEAKLLASLPAFDPALVQGPSPYYNLPPAALTRLYDEEGRRHAWNLFLWTGPGVDEFVFDRAQLHGLLAAGGPSPLAGRVFTDWVCSVCGVRWAQTDALDATKSAASVRRIETQSTFFTYFETRCPEGGVHSFGDSGGAACTKCGVSTRLLDAAGARRGALAADGEAAAYFKKYEATFLRRTADAERDAFHLVETPEDAPAGETLPALPISAVSRNFEPVLELTKLMQELGVETTTAEIEAMGATEGRTLAQVRSGEDAPPPPTRLTDPRITAAESNLRVLLTRYSTLWNSRGRPAAWLLEAHGWLGPLLAKLPDLPASVEALPAPAATGLTGAYFAKLNRLRESARAALAAQQAKERQNLEALAAVRAEWAAALHQHAVDSFCAAAMTIAKSGPAGELFVGSVVADILLAESRFTVPGEFQWSVFGDAEDISRSAEDSSGDDIRLYGAPGAGAEGADAEAARSEENSDGYGDGLTFSTNDLDMDADAVASNLEG